jgi:isopentenyl phosphate kinase
MTDNQNFSLQFLKLGGSLITDKSKPHTLREDVLDRLVGEIAQVYNQYPQQRLVLGHGSGSFAHVPAKQYRTRQGVYTHRQWHGFAEVWREAALLNRLVMEALYAASLPAIAFPPSSSITAEDGNLLRWDLAPLQAALAAGLLPVVYGDVIFDRVRGGTIFSTEDLFAYLAEQLHPTRILLAGIEPGVWAGYPERDKIIPFLAPENISEIDARLKGAAATDVTGGMASKVHQSLELVRRNPNLQVLIFSGSEPGTVKANLTGGRTGTVISNPAG